MRDLLNNNNNRVTTIRVAGARRTEPRFQRKKNRAASLRWTARNRRRTRQGASERIRYPRERVDVAAAPDFAAGFFAGAFTDFFVVTRRAPRRFFDDFER